MTNPPGPSRSRHRSIRRLRGFSRRCRPCEPSVAGRPAVRAFSRALRQRSPPRRDRRDRSGIFAHPVPLRPDLTDTNRLSRWEPSGVACASRADPCLAGHNKETAPAVGDSAYEIWLAPLQPELGRIRARPRGQARHRRLGQPTATAARSSGAHARCWGHPSTSSSPATPPQSHTRARRAAPCRDSGRRGRLGLGRGGGALQPPPHVRPVRDRRRQPARTRRRAGRGGEPGPGLQPALPPRTAGPWQDPPARRDRQLHHRLPARYHGPLHHRRGLHERVHRGAQRQGARAFQAASTATSTSS